jgi:hypothetical protein
MAIEKALIYKITPGGNDNPGDDPIEVCFNPKEYALEKSVDWESAKAKSDAPIPEFKQPKPMTLAVTLQFDTYEERCSVRDKYIRKLEALTFMTAQDLKSVPEVKKHSPPQVRFVWGKMHFRGVLESLSQKYTMFLADGTPVRCECGIKIRNVKEAAVDEGTAYGGGKTKTKSVPVNNGDRLDTLAAKHLGDASRWTEIAALNGIENPADLTGISSVEVPA